MFGLNFGKSKATSQSQSDAYGYSRSGSFSANDSRSASTSRAGSLSTQELAFQDLFAQLYGDSFGAAGRAAMVAPQLGATAGDLFNAGAGFLDTLQGGDAGSDYMAQRLGPNPALDASIDALGADIGRFFENNINPAITSRAVGTGQLGGGRQGVAQGLAVESSAREFQRGATDLRLADLAQRDAVAGQFAGLRQSGAVAGVSSLPGLYGLAEAGAGAELGVMERLAGILGGPLALTTSESYSESDAESIAQAIAESFGLSEDFATSSSSSTSKSKSFGLSF